MKTTVRSIAELAAATIIFVALGVFFSHCGDDNGDEEPESFAGTYVLTSAVVQEDVVYQGKTVQDADTVLQIDMGTPITVALATALTTGSPCDNPQNTAIDLRQGGQVWYVCTDGDTKEQQTGTWSENDDRTELTITISIGGTPFPLVVKNINKTATQITGVVESFPINAPIFVGAYSVINAANGGWPQNVVPPQGDITIIGLVDVAIEFDVVP